MIAFALLGCLAAYAFGREFGGPWAGLLCSAVLAVAPSYATFAGRISADLPAAALLVVAVALAFRGDRRQNALWRWVIIGGVVGLAFTIKLSALAIVPMLVLLLARRHDRWSHAAAFVVGAVVTVCVLVATHLGALHPLWRGAVSYHVAARKVAGSGTFADNAHRVVHYLDFKTGFGWLVVLALLSALWIVRRPQLEVLLPLLTFLVVSAIFIVWQRPLHDNHLVLLAVALALPTGYILSEAVGAASPEWVRIAVVTMLALLLVGGYAQEVRRLFRNQIELSADDRSVVTEIRRRSPAYLARRQVPGKLVDTAVLRFDAGYLSVRDVEREIATRQVDVVVAGRAFTQYPALMQWLGTHFARRAQHGDVAVFSRD
jgi:4-amino-4-deoxy-L-arabinose transferase-like glycosyltransferase